MLVSRAKVEARNTLETYIYNLKTSYEDSLKDKIAPDDVEKLKASVEAGLEVSRGRSTSTRMGYSYHVLRSEFAPHKDCFVCRVFKLPRDACVITYGGY